MVKYIQLALILVFLSQGFMATGNNSVIDSLKREVDFADNDTRKCDLFNRIASEYLDINPSEAIFYANKAFQLSIRLDYEKGLARSYLIQGIANESLSKYEEALDNLYSAFHLQKHLNIENEIAEINYRLGRVCKTIGNYESALEYCLNALRIIEKQDDQLRISDVYNTMGSIYKYISDYEKALEYYYKSHDIQNLYREGGVSDYIYNNIGIVYGLLDRWDEALAYYEKSLKIREEDNDSLGIASSYNNIAVVYMDQEKLDSVIYYLRKSQDIKEKLGDQRSLINVYQNLGEYYYKCHNYSEALFFAKKAISIAQQLKISNSVRSIYELLKNIYQAMGEFDKALNFQVRYTQISDSIYNTEKSMNIAQLAILYDSELAQVEHELKDQRNRFINIAIYAVFIFSLVILFFIYKGLKAKFSRNKLLRINLELEKEKLRTELETKDRELTKNIIYLTEKNELLYNLNKTLKKLKCNMKDENKSSIQSVINEMTVSYNNKMWDEFEVHFTNVHENFYENINKDHPDLSQNEKRLAAFLKLNLASKEISMITKQSVHSITVARTRLRKKLNLSNTDTNLVSYLAKY